MPTKPIDKIVYTPQEMLNMSFDDDFRTIIFQLMGYDPTNNTLNRLTVIPGTGVLSPSGIGLPAYDYVSLNTTSTTDTYTFKTGGSGGITVATITITYTDSTKATLSSVAKT